MCFFCFTYLATQGQLTLEKTELLVFATYSAIYLDGGESGSFLLYRDFSVSMILLLVFSLK